MKHTTSIFAQIRQEVYDFVNNYINIVDGYSFNQYQTIKKCHLYYNSRFISGELDSNGRKKIFFNVVKSPCKVASRFLNFDTKDIRLISNTKDSEMATFLLERELKNWMKQNKTAITLNKIAELAPVYGSVVLKKTKKGADIVDLRRLILDPTVDTITNSRFVELEHNLTPSQLRAKQKDGWENVEEVINKFYTSKAPESYLQDGNLNQVVSTPSVKIYERYGEVPESWLKGTEAKEDDKMVRALFIVAGVDNFQTGEDGKTVVQEEGIILFKSKWFDDYPFRDFHFDKTEGRWLGVGIIEDLFQIQERTNELTNEKRESMRISTMHIFQTQDRTIVKNVLRDLSNGAVLMAGPNGGLTPLANEERNLGAFTNEEARYSNQAKELTFSYDAVRGDSLPTSTPATNAVIQDRNVKSVYGVKRENLANMLRFFFTDLVIPQAVKDLTPEHIMHFTGTPEELAKLDGVFVKNIAGRMAIDMLLSGKPVYTDDYEAIRESVRKMLTENGADRFITIKDAFYKNADWTFDINIDNEQEDSQLLTNNLFSVFSALASNPGILQDPVIKALFYEYAERAGVSPMKLEIASIQKSEQDAQMAQAQMAQPARIAGQPAKAVGQSEMETAKLQ